MLVKLPLILFIRYVKDPSRMAAALLSPLSGIPSNGHMIGHMTGHMAGGSEGAVNKDANGDVCTLKLAPPEIQVTKM